VGSPYGPQMDHLLLCTSPISWQPDSPLLASPASRQQDPTIICSLSSSDFKVPQLSNVVVSLCRASGNTLYWVEIVGTICVQVKISMRSVMFFNSNSNYASVFFSFIQSKSCIYTNCNLPYMGLLIQ
jgi:hypothetical protein